MSETQDMLNYKSLTQNKPHHREQSKGDRFVRINLREETCDIPSPIWPTLLEGSYKQHWRDMHIEKSPMEMVLYPMLLHELQPKTIIEIGALNGGSAVWLTDHLTLFGIEGRVYAMDIDLSLLDETAKNDTRISFLQGDANHIEATFTPEMLASLPHPWLIIEDAHMNLSEVLNYFHLNGLQSGDYLIVEDTNLFLWDYWDKNWKAEENRPIKDMKVSHVKHFVMNHQDEYVVDTYYQNLFGYNESKCWNSILKKV